MKVSIVGASGYTGGELLRLLLFHPQVEIGQVTSESHVGEYVYQQHPNLRKRTQLQFTARDQLQPCDVLFLALPHGEAQKNIDKYLALAPKIVDLSADFRLKDAALYKQWYGHDHTAPQHMGSFVYGLPEVQREAMKTATRISGVGCNATASNLALLPLVKADLLDLSSPVFIEIKVGSSEGGAEGNSGSLHAERGNVIRTFSAFGHRHTAEVIQEMGVKDVSLTMTAVELVRGVLATAHVWTRPGITDRDLWSVYRQAYRDEPFVRLVKAQGTVYRYPEPKLLAGTNWADVGFEADTVTGRVVSIAAIDNLGKGAAGSALQCLNLMCGFDERMGLEFPGLHPV